MEENRFFVFVWRLNSLVFLVAAVLAVGVLGIVGYLFFQDSVERSSVGFIAHVGADQLGEDMRQLGRPTRIENSPYVIIPLHSNRRHASSYSRMSPYQDSGLARSSIAISNILFVNTQSNEKRWLLPTNEFFIGRKIVIRERRLADNKIDVKAILYTIVKADTNGDNRLTHEDQSVIALSLPSGQEYTEILQEIDDFMGHVVLEDDAIFLVYQKQGVGYAANVSLQDFSISVESELPIVEDRP